VDIDSLIDREFLDPDSTTAFVNTSVIGNGTLGHLACDLLLYFT